MNIKDFSHCYCGCNVMLSSSGNDSESFICSKCKYDFLVCCTPSEDNLVTYVGYATNNLLYCAYEETGKFIFTINNGYETECSSLEEAYKIMNSHIRYDCLE